ncbi:hypothetical protein HAZT_HAZT008629 [Hyalella azteca]|uniref:Uncharacterized protein n=1 Tax=Hyalella azteca TaxID=294128 RepID=A0A6A0HHR5_HYAAZ|nr:hypothetical protein HAZT_HAZT008629 [Hyalella azteca]
MVSIEEQRRRREFYSSSKGRIRDEKLCRVIPEDPSLVSLSAGRQPSLPKISEPLRSDTGTGSGGVLCSKLEDQNSKRVSLMASSENLLQKPENLLHKSEGLLQKPESLLHKSEGLLQKPEALLHKSENLLQKPGNLLHKPENLLQKPENLLQKPENLLKKPENLLQKPANLIQKSENLIQKAENLLQKPQNLLQKPENLLQKQENLCSSMFRFSKSKMICSSDLLCVQLVSCHLLKNQCLCMIALIFIRAKSRRFLQCPAMVPMSLIKRLLRTKFSLTSGDTLVFLVPDIVKMRRSQRTVSAAAVVTMTTSACTATSVSATSCAATSGNATSCAATSGNATSCAATSVGATSAATLCGHASVNAISVATSCRATSVDAISTSTFVNAISAATSCAATSVNATTPSSDFKMGNPAAASVVDEVRSKFSGSQPSSDFKMGNPAAASVVNEVRSKFFGSQPSSDFKIGNLAAASVVDEVRSAANKKVVESHEVSPRDEDSEGASLYPGLLLLDSETVRDVAYLQDWDESTPVTIFFKIVHHTSRRLCHRDAVVMNKEDLLSIPSSLGATILPFGVPFAQPGGGLFCLGASNDIVTSDPSLPPLTIVPVSSDSGGSFEPVSTAGKVAAPNGGDRVDVGASSTATNSSLTEPPDWKEVQLKISETGIMSVSAGDDQNNVMESLLNQVESESSQRLLSSIETEPDGSACATKDDLSDDELPPLRVCENFKRKNTDECSDGYAKKPKVETSNSTSVVCALPFSSPADSNEERPVLNRKTSKLKEIAEKQRSLFNKSSENLKKDARFVDKNGIPIDVKSRHVPLDVAAATITANLKNLSKLSTNAPLSPTVGPGSRKVEVKTDCERPGRKSHSTGYKTLNTSPKGWNPTISKEQFQLGVSNAELQAFRSFEVTVSFWCLHIEAFRAANIGDKTEEWN